MADTVETSNEAAKIAEARDKFPNLTDDEFMEVAAKNVGETVLAPLLRQALGLEGEEARSDVYPIMDTISQASEEFWRTMVEIRKLIGEQ